MKNQKLPFFLLFLIILIISTSCPEPKVIRIETGNLLDTSYTSATIKGTIIDPGEGIVEHGHCWSTSPDPNVGSGNETKKGSRNTAGNFTSELKDLAAGTYYYIRAYATDGNGPMIYGED
ncbi:hypothetical protein ES705_12659 [subsurface metagenome]